jgi:glycosyltransferase involved in cell wall biosynthesis
MNIGIDIRYLSHGIVGGVRNYVRYLVPALLAQGAAHRFLLYADTKAPLELDAGTLPGNATLRLLTYRNALSSFYHDMTLAQRMAHDGVNAAYFPANYGFGPRGALNTFTLHDALTIMPLRKVLAGKGSRMNLRTLLMTAYLNVCSTTTLRRADVMFAASENARRDIMRHCAFDPKRIVLAHYGVPPYMRRIPDERALEAVRARLGLPARFVLGDALKNPAVLARAWARLPKSLQASHRVVFFSRRPDPLPVVGRMVDAGIAQMLLRPSDDDLVALYNLADAFVFPSWIEGFGIPLLEAMTCGAPVIASDRGSIPEIAGGAARIIDAEDDAALASALTEVLQDPIEAIRLRSAGFARAAQFSWQSAAAKMISAIENGVAQKRVLGSLGSRRPIPTPGDS